MKEKLCLAPYLAYLGKDKVFTLRKAHCLSATQKYDIKQLIVVYAKWPLSGVKVKSSDCEKSLLATIWAVEHFHSYIDGQKVIIETCHQPVTFLNSQQLREGSTFWVVPTDYRGVMLADAHYSPATQRSLVPQSHI